MEKFDKTLRQKIIEALGQDIADYEGVVFGCSSGSGFVASDYAGSAQITGFRLDAGKLIMEVSLRDFLYGRLLHLEYAGADKGWRAVVQFDVSRPLERYPVELETY